MKKTKKITQSIEKLLEKAFGKILLKIRKKIYYNISLRYTKVLYQKIHTANNLSDVHLDIFLALVKLYEKQQKHLMKTGEKLKFRRKSTVITDHQLLEQHMKHKTSTFNMKYALATLVKTGVVEIMAVQHNNNKHNKKFVTQKLTRYKLNVLVSRLAINLKKQK